MTFWIGMFWACCVCVGGSAALAGAIAAYSLPAGVLSLLGAFVAAWCANDAFGHVRVGWAYHR